MAVLNITITQVTTQDYDGVDETVKKVVTDIDGADTSQTYSYPTTTDDATITAEIRTDLSGKGYVFD